MSAETSAFEALPNLRGITWHYVPRFNVTGTLKIGSDVTEVSGAGYLERRRGRFWTPGISRGLWESIPGPGASPFSIPLFYKVWKNDGTIQLQTLTFTLNGTEMVDFEEVDVEVLETARLAGFEDIEHPMRYRLTASGDGGNASIEVVRSPHRLGLRNYFDDPDLRAQWTGLYGAGHAKGSINYEGVDHEVDGPSYGSALFFSEKTE
jgi:hypothetical protein